MSVVTACRDESNDRIAATFASIAAQRYPHIERIVVDGGSGAATLQALRALSPPAERLVSEPDGGVMDAMNKGVHLAGGELVAFMNVGDRYLGEGALDALVGVFARRRDVAFACGDFVRVRRDGGRVPVRSPEVSRFRLFCGQLCHQTTLARRDLFETIGAFDLALGPLADMDWFARVLEAGHVGVHCGATICEYEAGGQSVRSLAVYYAALARFRRDHFTPAERAAFRLGDLVSSALRRLREWNFAPPARVGGLARRTLQPAKRVHRASDADDERSVPR